MQAVEETKSHVEKKQALTYEEMEAEREEVVFCHHLCSILCLTHCRFHLPPVFHEAMKWIEPF